MTTIINFYGAPSAGKSTEAAKLFVKYKEAGKSVELVTEYAKEWVWEDRKIRKFDQLYITATQIHRETRLLGEVDFIITDSPVLLGAFYDEYYNRHTLVRPAVTAYMELLAHLKVKSFHHWLTIDRKKEHTISGRLHNLAECRKIEGELLQFLTEFPIRYTDLKNGKNDR